MVGSSLCAIFQCVYRTLWLKTRHTNSVVCACACMCACKCWLFQVYAEDDCLSVCSSLQIATLLPHNVSVVMTMTVVMVVAMAVAVYWEIIGRFVCMHAWAAMCACASVCACLWFLFRLHYIANCNGVDHLKKLTILKAISLFAWFNRTNEMQKFSNRLSHFVTQRI